MPEDEKQKFPEMPRESSRPVKKILDDAGLTIMPGGTTWQTGADKEPKLIPVEEK